MQVFSQEWFEYHQKKILRFANTKLGRRFFHITNDVPKNKKLVSILPNCITWQEDNGQYTTDFRTHDKFAKRLYYGLKPLWYVLHGWDFIFGNLAQQLDFGFSSLTAFPDAGHASTTTDEGIDRSSVDESLAVIRAGAGVAYGYTNFGYTRDGNTAAVGMNGSGTSNQFATLGRFIATFDTSSLTAGVAVSAGTISLYGFGSRANIGTPDLHSCASTPVSSSNIAISDFSNMGTTSFGSLAGASWNNAAYNDIALDGNGRNNVSLTGISKFGWKLNWDINNSFTGAWATDASSFEFKTADTGGTSNDPKLVITYSIVASSGASILLSLV